MTEDRRGSFQKSLSHSTGQRNLSKSSNSKASKLLGVSTDEVLEASQKDLFRRRSSNDLDIPTGLQDDDDEEEQEQHEHGQRTSTKSSVGSGGSSSSKWSRNDSTSSATSTGSKIGGILKSSRVKFKSRRATVDEGSNNNNNLASSLTRSEDSTAEGGGTATTTTSTAITRRGISWGSSKSDQENEDNIDNTSDKVTPLDHRPNPFPLPQDKPRFKLMERSMSRKTRKSFRVGGGVGVGSTYNPHNKAPALGVGGSTFYVSDPNDPRATKGDPFHNALRINNCNNMVKHIRVNDILSNMNSSSSKKDAGSDYNKDQDSLTSLIFKSLSNKGMCDVQLVGGLDDVIVNAPSYLLGVHSKVLESLFFYSPPPKDGATATATANENKAAVVEGEEFFDTSCTSLNDLDTDASAASERNNNANNTRVVEIPFATHTALKAMLHFLATRSLPDNLENDANESNIRCICQIYLFGRLYKISSLQNHAYRIARLLMNKLPRLVCAAFDECIASTKRLPEKRRLSSSSVDELMDCCLEYLRETPLTTLLDGGTIFLNEDSIGAIICDQDMDVDEHTMFHILNTWVKQDLEGNIETGKALVSNINLAYIKTDYLNNVVRKCGFVDASDVQNALKEIEEMLANQSPDEKEHVLVEGAGNDVVNGIYVRMDEDIGMGEEEVLFIKEAPEDDYSCSDYGLYLLRSTWAITPCVDYSNILYSCDVRQSTSSTSHSRPPKSGWVSDSSADPPPTCTWNPSKDNNAKANGKGYVAPNLADVGRNNRQLSDVANGDHCEGSLVRRLTLRTMINLPTDEDFEDDDYA